MDLIFNFSLFLRFLHMHTMKHDHLYLPFPAPLASCTSPQQVPLPTLCQYEREFGQDEFICILSSHYNHIIAFLLKPQRAIESLKLEFI